MSSNPESNGAARPQDLHPNLTRPNTPIVVGIGASAGGLAALKTFFDQVPPESNLAFVVVVHLAPDHKSHLADLLQPHTQFPVQQVVETMELERNRVYVIPPNANISAIDTHLRLSDLEEERGKRAPIDHFFRTLANTHDGHAIGVILTGTGSDGTLGIKDIKAKGGVIIVQDPNDAEYDGMPQSAIATGLADFILPVAEIPGTILRFERTEPKVVVPAEEGIEIGKDEASLLQRLFVKLRSQTDRDFSRYKRPTVLRRIARRMQLNYIEDLQTYLDRLGEQPQEAQALADDLLVTVTNFFRDPAVFEKLEKDVIPKLFENKEATDSIRVWSVGCATGEEAYSLAMLLVEEAARQEKPIQIQVFASDLHGRSLEKAREGFYPGDIEADVSPERLRRFFVRENTGYHIRKSLRELVVFAPHNLLSDPPFSRLDLISCRNLLIYLQREVQRAVIDLFHYALRPGGSLLLGSAETVETLDLFWAEDKKLCLYRKRNVPVSEPRLPVFHSVRRSYSDVESKELETVEPPLASGTLHQRMVEQYAPPSLLISPDNKVVHLSQHAGRYLVHPGGEPTANIFKLVRKELRVELQGLLQTTREKKEPCDSLPTAVELDGVMRPVVMHVGPAREPQQDGFVLVIFEEREVPKGEPADSKARFSESEQSDRADDMERHSILLRDRLRSVIEEYETSQEEMKASHEEMQSTNEELRSTMEELETSKEELQSINEELQTVNQENRHKVEELAQLSGDLQNLLSATGIATLFLDSNLRIQRFTPKATELFNIRMTDRGRPISDLTHRLGYTTLQEDSQSVLRDLYPVEREVKDDGGRWYLTRVLPYRSTEDRIEGVVITFVEISRRVEAETLLRQSEMRLATELDAMKHLHDLVNQLLVSSDLKAALNAVLASAIEIMKADKGHIQLRNKSSKVLKTVAQQGIGAESHPSVETSAGEPDSPWSQAFNSRRKIIIGDTKSDPLLAAGKKSGKPVSYRSLQIIPMISRNGDILGLLSTQAAQPHVPSEHDLRVLELYTRQAADFVERFQAEEELRHSEERYRLLIENAREYAILMLDSKGKVGTWSTGAERIFGYTEQEIIGSSGAILFTEEDRAAGIPEMEIQTALKKGGSADDRWQLRKDGSRFWASGAMEMLDSPAGELKGFVKVLRDNSERKKTEESLLAQERNLLQANESLQQANANLKQFAFAASHDLREPLRTIAAYTTILIDSAQKGQSEDAQKAARFIVEGTQRMGQLLTDLLTYMQLTVEEEDVLEQVDLNVVLANTISDLHAMIAQTAAQLTSDKLPTIFGRESHFVQLFQNLIANSMKYRSSLPLTVHVSCQKRGNEWLLSVKDNGIGIDPSYHEQVFGVFKRLHGSKIPGTGIGLAICRRIVERSGGRIWVESAVDEGSTFYMTIPMTDEKTIASNAGR